ncbi:LAMI_0F09076g1_1 [Lachancea mirantina]|uniref:Protein kinase C-like 1 n=1 Tax=Lachancea mirantina TaxID=1230905 RepID=A0A1G4K121_9SACH|nr:LAMI_0F09076g1_1 [Lachancea mirantina]
MITKVEHDIHKKIEREQNIIQGASQLKKKTDNVMVIQKCNTNIREAQQNIQYLEETLAKIHMRQDPANQEKTSKNENPAYGQLSTIAPEEHLFSRLDLVKYDCPSLSQRIQYMLQQLEFKLQVEHQYQEANEKLTKLYRIDGDQRSSSAAEGGSRESKQRIQLLTKALKKYQAINVDLDPFMDASAAAAQNKYRRKQLSGVLTIGINAIRDVDHVQSPLFSRKPETFIIVKIDDTVRAKTKPSRNDRWHDEYNIHVEKGNEIEIAVYDRVNDQMVPVAVMWLLLSDIAEEIRKRKAGQVTQNMGQAGWSNSRDATSGTSGPTLTLTSTNSAGKELKTDSDDLNDSSQSITSHSWFVLESSGQILLTLGFKKSDTPSRKHLMGGLHRHGAIINRKEDVYEQHGHHFVQKSFYNIMSCAYCGEFLRYTGFQCQDCKFLCHKKCYDHVVTKCIAKTSTDTDPDEAKLNHRIPHRFEPFPNRGTKWCCHCGYILPWGRKNVRKCSECGIMCHAQCAHLVPDFCGMSMEMANTVLTAIQDTKRTQEQRRKIASSVNKIGTKEHVYSDVHSHPSPQKPLPRAPDEVRRDLDDFALKGELFKDEMQELKPTSNSHPTLRPTAPQNVREEHAKDRLNDFIDKNAFEYDDFSRTLDPAHIEPEQEISLQGVDASITAKLRENDWYQQQVENAASTSTQTEDKYNDEDTQALLETRPFSNTEAVVEPRVKVDATPSQQYNGSNNPFRQAAYPEMEREAVASVAYARPVPDQQQQQPIGTEALSKQPSPQKQHGVSKHKKRGPKRRKISLDDFILLKVLGKGNFGKVLLAKSKNNERLCAIKVLKKDHIIKNHDIESARAEKKVFLLATKAKHPFLTNLFCSFQTENRIYFAMEFIGAGDLMWHVQNQRLSVRRAKFYAAEVLLALKYFHDNGVIYRDLKLENILLTPEGHIKIADYGLCKDEMWYGNRTSTFCGTPEFMAPEILKEQEYTKAVDWWAFGVLLYQMLLCQSPFSGDDEDEVFNAILTDEPLYPIDMAGDIVQIFQGLLTKDPERRLGAGPRDALEVMEEPFFRNVNFDDILNMRIQPPYVPEIKAADDTSYFEKEFTSAPPTLTPLPSVLSSDLQEEFRGFSFMPEDLLL